MKPLYKLQLQVPYGTVVREYISANAANAAYQLTDMLRTEGHKFVAVTLGGKEIAPHELRDHALAAILARSNKRSYRREAVCLM